MDTNTREWESDHTQGNKKGGLTQGGKESNICLDNLFLLFSLLLFPEFYEFVDIDCH